MILTPYNILYYLLDHNILTPDSVVDGDFIVAEQSSRNRNFKVIRRDSPGFFVKQAKDLDPQSIASLRTEAATYWLAQTSHTFSGLKELVPRFYNYDPQRNVLIVELLTGGENLGEYHRRLGKFPTEIAAELGRTLGSYHRNVNPLTGEEADKTGFPRRVPWILSAHQLSANGALGNSPANTEVLSIIGRYPEFQQTLQALQTNWEVTGLVHGDIKWENCVVTGPLDREDGKTVKIVDWELADLGDPCWDVGAIFQAYLSFWIFSIPVTTMGDIGLALELAQYPIEDMQPAIHAFWNAYSRTREASAEEAPALLRRSVQYGAARMLQTAYEYMYYSPQITINSICLLQVSLNILERPEEAIEHLLGFAA